MLTDAQYQALKALGDDTPGPVALNAELVLDLFDGKLLWARPTRKGHDAIRDYVDGHQKAISEACSILDEMEAKL